MAHQPEEQMQNSAVLGQIPWVKVWIILMEGSVAGFLLGLVLKAPEESSETVVAFSLFGTGVASAIAKVLVERRHEPHN